MSEELCDYCAGEGACPECGDIVLDDPTLCGECSGDMACPACGGTGTTSPVY